MSNNPIPTFSGWGVQKSRMEEIGKDILMVSYSLIGMEVWYITVVRCL